MEEIVVVEPAPAVETEVFLGLSREHAANVPPRAVVRFVRDEVMPHVPRRDGGARPGLVGGRHRARAG